MSVPSSIERYLEDHEVPYSILRHPIAFTAQEEAAAAHVPGGAWAKTVVCFADEDPVLAVLPAPLMVDTHRLRVLLGAQTVRIAHEDDFSRLYPACAVGAMPPFGELYHQRVYVDRHLAGQDQIVFNAGSHRDAILMRYHDFARLVRPVVGDFCRPVE
jgi:Ala-tRNA(Pro) deacylase